MQNYLIKMLLVSGVSVASSLISLRVLIPILTKKAFLDIPNARSSHKKITPRGGGLGVLIGILCGSLTAFCLSLPVPHFTFYIGFLLIAATSFLDDKNSLPVYVRLAIHLTAMAVVLYHTGGLQKLPFPAPMDIQLGNAGYIISGIWIVAVINFFNFLDGIDGFAGSQATVAGLGLTVLLWSGLGATIGISIAMASLGFLFYNWHPAKVFMGDVGSISLGFIFATLPFYAQPTNAEPIVYSVALFLWFFLADGAFTLIRRSLKKEKIWQPHRTHLYQRLNQTGWPHDKVVTLVIGLSLVIISAQIYFFLHAACLTWTSLIIGIILFIVYVALVTYLEHRKKAA